MIQPGIKNIIFDLGGIFIDVDYHKTTHAFAALGIHFDDFYQQSYAHPLFAQLEKGEIDPAFFYQQFREATNSSLTNAQITTAWNAMLGTFRKSSVAILPVVSQQYRIFLLSNINAIHYEAIQNTYFAQCQNRNFNNYFIKAYYSHLSHQRKPDAAAYEMIVTEHQLIKAETLFVDDTIKNINAAQALGLQTLLLEKNMLVETALGFG